MGQGRASASRWRSRKVQAGDTLFHVAEAGPAIGPAVLLLHGFPEDWRAWQQLIDPLADAGFRVIAPDLKGYADTPGPTNLSAYRPDHVAQEVAQLADVLQLGRFALVGHDWGGLIAWHVGCRLGERLSALAIMSAPHPAVMRRFALRHPRQLLRSAYIAFFQLPYLPEAVLRMRDFALLRRAMRKSAQADLFPGDLIDHYAEQWRRPGRLSAMLAYYRALRLPGTPAVGLIDQPTLILWGDRDTFLDVGLAHASAAMCAHAQRLTISGGTHWLHHEAPDQVAAALLQFLHSSLEPLAARQEP